jgi:hypothetical protein
MQITLRQAELAIGKPSTLRNEIRAALHNDELYLTVADYFSPPGVTGSKAYDQGVAVQKILDWDVEKNGKKISAYKASHRELWVHVYAVLGGAFQVSHGRVIGLLEVKPADASAAEATAAAEAAGTKAGGDIE